MPSPATTGPRYEAGAESSQSAVSWGAIIAGAITGAALALILLALGAGFGLASVSPWQGQGVSGTTFGAIAALWLIIVQIVSSTIGGYLTGRLRTRWSGIKPDEAYFRDTAHGFLSWAVGALVSATILGSAASSLIGGTVQAGGSVVSGLGSAITQVGGQAAGAAAGQATAQGGLPGDPTAYFTDTLFRSNRPAPDANDQNSRAEVGRILTTSLANGSVSPADRTYLAQLISQRAGISQDDAGKRIDDTVSQAKAAADAAATKARQAADVARKSATALSLWTFVSLLIGAFVAAFSATLGGRQRDA